MWTVYATSSVSPAEFKHAVPVTRRRFVESLMSIPLIALHLPLAGFLNFSATAKLGVTVPGLKQKFRA